MRHRRATESRPRRWHQASREAAQRFARERAIACARAERELAPALLAADVADAARARALALERQERVKRGRELEEQTVRARKAAKLAVEQLTARLRVRSRSALMAYAASPSLIGIL